ncbi:CD48 antigen [Anabarilius grahami]|uniref:CD48 antigen n=1 Tax=Anabarilius grahami TaxID=495550 RepID=A0A3N0Y365_ANAGA|nr:CD48 antigen [Anabarilius grahami]
MWSLHHKLEENVDFRVFVADAVKSESVTEGESVSLNSSFTQIHTHEEINWKFGDFLIAKVKRNKESKFYGESAEGRFRDRLKLDQTGSLTIINSRTTDSGLYTVSSIRRATINTINLTVYARLPVPVISCNSSSTSSSSSCSLVCSAVNVSHVTLSWFKGNSSFSNISVSDLSIHLSLPLEVEYQDKNTYSCVINNPIRNQTQHLNITELCQPCAAEQSTYARVQDLIIITFLKLLKKMIDMFIFFWLFSWSLTGNSTLRSKRIGERHVTQVSESTIQKLQILLAGDSL